MNRFCVHELMSRQVFCVAPDARVGEAVQLFQRCNSSCVVVAKAGVPVGLVTARDLVKILADQTATDRVVAEIMSSPPICLDENAKIYEALVIIQTRGIRHIPIVDRRHHVVGIITESAIARAYFTSVKEQRGRVEEQVRHRTHELVNANKKLRALALQDSLLRVGNRRAMEVDVHFTHVNAVRYARPYALALVDVDFFKLYNDYYGHPAGDDVLKQVAECIKSSMRTGDRLYRYGGEEFLVLMPETTLPEAVEATGRVVENVQALRLSHRKSPYSCVTISAGIDAAAGAVAGSHWKMVVAEADRRLYRAKELGRNQVCWYSPRPARLSDTQSVPCIH